MRKKNLARAINIGLLAAGLCVMGGYSCDVAMAGTYTYTGEQYAFSKDFTVDGKDFVADPEAEVFFICDEKTGDSGSNRTPLYLKGDVTAKSITITNSKENASASNQKGIYAYNGHFNLKAETITINSIDDGIFTTKNTGGEAAIDGDDADINLSGFDNLTITSTKGFGIVNNGNRYGPWYSTKGGSDINVIGNSGSTITITGGYNETEILSKAAITNTANTETNVSGGNINLIGSTYVVSAYAGKVNINAEQNNTLKGETTGICTSGSKTEVNVIGENNTLTAKGIGINNSFGKTNITAEDTNIIKSEDLGVTVSGKTGVVNISAKDNYITAENTALKVSEGVINVESKDNTVVSGDIFAEKGGKINSGFDTEQSYLYGKVNTVYKTTSYDTVWNPQPPTDGYTLDKSKQPIILEDREYFYLVNEKGEYFQDDKGNLYVGWEYSGSFDSGIYLQKEQVRHYDTATNLNFKDGASWYMTGDSNVTKLTLDKSFVYMNGTEKGNPRKLVVDKSLKGGDSTFVMDLAYLNSDDVKTYAEAKDSDFLVFDGTSEGTYKIKFAQFNDDPSDDDTEKPEELEYNLDAMKEQGSKLYFAQVNNTYNTKADFAESETVTQVNDRGLYDHIFKTGFDNEDKDIYDDWFITYEKDRENPNAETPIHSYNAAFALWRDDDTLLKRLGELRYTNDEGGVWARIIGKKLEMDGAYGFESEAKTVQVGYDRKDVQADGSGTWRKGVALGYTEADTSFGVGDGENNYIDMSLYATNLRSKDHYLDLVARVGNIDSEYDTMYGDHGDANNWAASISAEYGRKKKMNEDNWFIEPQAQLTYSYLWGDDFTTDLGTSVRQDDADSLVGRLGFIISREYESERKYPNRIYAKASVLHEFLGESGVDMRLEDESFDSGVDFGDTWYVVGVGANADMGNNCTFYFDAERAFKADVKMPYRVEAGFRWEF